MSARVDRIVACWEALEEQLRARKILDEMGPIWSEVGSPLYSDINLKRAKDRVEKADKDAEIAREEWKRIDIIGYLRWLNSKGLHVEE